MNLYNTYSNHHCDVKVIGVLLFCGMKIFNCSNKRKEKNKEKKAFGLVDHIVNKLPEIHIPGYQYCGPGTDIEKRLKRGDTGINKLDEACKEHDIAYEDSVNSESRHKADKKLVSRAFKRVYSNDAKLSERAAALLVSGLIGAKIGLSKIGLGFDNNSSSSYSTHKKMKRRKNVRRRRTRKRKTTRRKFGGAIRRVKRRTRRSRRKQRVLRLPSRFVGRVPSVFRGSGLYLKPYHEQV